MLPTRDRSRYEMHISSAPEAETTSPMIPIILAKCCNLFNILGRYYGVIIASFFDP
jgi:hypothetical protein